VLQVYLQKLSQMMSHEEDLDLYSKSAPVKRRKRNPGGNPSQKRPYYGELEDFDLGKGDPHIIFKNGTCYIRVSNANFIIGYTNRN
jgi:hypothetical protein